MYSSQKSVFIEDKGVLQPIFTPVNFEMKLLVTWPVFPDVSGSPSLVPDCLILVSGFPSLVSDLPILVSDCHSLSQPCLRPSHPCLRLSQAFLLLSQSVSAFLTPVPLRQMPENPWEFQSRSCPSLVSGILIDSHGFSPFSHSYERENFIWDTVKGSTIQNPCIRW